MTRGGPVVVAVFGVVAGVAFGGCNRVASLSFAQPGPLVLEDDKGKKAPAVVAHNKNGDVVDPPPPVTITVEPAGIVTLDGDKILPAKNGDAKLVAKVMDDAAVPPAELPIHVAVVDDIRVTCPESGCGLHVGENLQLESVAHGLGERIDGGIEWTSSDTSKATVTQQGQVSGVAAGPVVITAKLGKRSTETKLEVHQAVDEVRLLCPWPPLVVDVKRGEASPSGERSCEVLEGEDVSIEAVTLAHGVIVNGERIDWHSSDPSVRVVGGTVTGDHAGGAMIEVKANGVAAEMPFSVVPAGLRGLGNGHCSGGEASLTNRFTVALALKNAAGEKQDEPREYRCETTAAKRCLDDAGREIARAVEKLAFDMRSAAGFGEAALDERARRCCCRR